MFFTWSWWYLVVVLLIGAIVGLAVVLIKMDKKDVELIKQFQDENTVEEVEETSEPSTTKANE